MDGVHDAERLKELQSLPLERKIQITQTRIIEWYQHYDGQVCVSFSGGKDSTVLLHIARQLYPGIPAVFSNTGLEYAAIQRFVKTYDNVDIIVPQMRFDEVISTYGYPLIGKEVAEAIHYARRIRSQSVNVERERERQRTTDGNSTVCGNELPKARPAMQTKWKRLEMGGQNSHLIQTSNARNRRTVLSGRMHGAGVANNGKTGEGGVFSNPVEQFGAKSQFNKEKWLPLCRDVPILISHYCCHKMKKQPMHKYQRANGYKPILATLAEESRVRKQAWIRHGCNAFESSAPLSQPMAFWTEQDVLSYLVKYNLPIASVYGEIVSIGSDGNAYPPSDVMGNPLCNLKCTGCQRTGCVYCAFGAHLEKKGETRFQQLAKLEPRKYEYAIGGGQWSDNPYYDPVAPEYDGEWKNWNPKKIWTPSKQGLGLGKAFDMVNELYGKDFIRYE